MSPFWKGKKVIVLGASGFIGSHAVEALIGKGAIVTAHVSKSSNPSKIKRNLGTVLNKIKVVSGDLKSFNNCLKILNGHNIVLNFAAKDGSRAYKAKNSNLIYRTNVKIIKNVLESSRLTNVDRVLIISSTEVNIKKAPDGYIKSKKFAEKLGKLYVKKYGMKIAIARPGNTYGPRDAYDKNRERVIPSFIKNSLEGTDIKVWGTGDQKGQFVYVTDLIQGLLDLVEKHAVGDPVNIVGSKKISVLDLAKMIIKEIKSKNRIVLEDKEDMVIKRRAVSNLKALRVINFSEKVKMSNGLRTTIDYFRSLR